MNILFKTHIVALLMILALCTPSYVHADEIGFIKDGFLISNTSPREGDTVSLFATLTNNSPHSLSVTVNFYDKILYLGKKDITVFSGDTLSATILWQVPAGSHTLSARLFNPNLIHSDGTREAIYIENAILEGPSFTVVDELTSTSMPYASTPELGTIIGQIRILEEAIARFVPSSLTDPLGLVFLKLEYYRLDLSARVRVLYDEKRFVKMSFAELSETEKLSPTYLYVKRPLTNIAMAYYWLTGFILSHHAIFYGLFLLTAGLFARRIIAFFKRLYKKYASQRLKSKINSIH